MTLGEKICELRTECGFTQPQLCERIAEQSELVLEQYRISRLETGTKPFPAELFAILKALGVEADDIGTVMMLPLRRAS